MQFSCRPDLIQNKNWDKHFNAINRKALGIHYTRDFIRELINARFILFLIGPRLLKYEYIGHMTH